MIGAPILVRISERSGYDQLAMFLAYFGYTWMGIVFLFVAASLVVDAYRIIIRISSFLLPEKPLLQINPKPAFYTPDILVSTGDLVDGQINKLEGLAEMLQNIKPRYGKYAVTGNHEFYAGQQGKRHMGSTGPFPFTSGSDIN